MGCAGDELGGVGERRVTSVGFMIGEIRYGVGFRVAFFLGEVPVGEIRE